MPFAWVGGWVAGTFLILSKHSSIPELSGNLKNITINIQ